MEPFDTSGRSNMEENDQIKEGDVMCLHQSEENGNSLQRTSVSDEESSGNAGVETESDKTSGIANETVFSSREDICDVSVITNGTYGNKLRVLCSNVVDHSCSENEMTKEMSGGGQRQEMENNNPVDACANLTPASAEVTSLAEQKSHINVVNSEDNVTEEPEIELRNGKSQEVVSLCSVNDTLSERSEGILNLKDGPIGDRCLQEMTNKAVDACDLISVSEKCTSLEQQRNYIGSVVLEEDASRTEDPVIEVHGMKPEKDGSSSFSENGTHTERLSEGIVNLKNDDFGDGCHQEMTNNKAVDDCDLISLSEKCTSLEQQRNYTGSVVLEEDASRTEDPVIEVHGMKPEKDVSFSFSENGTHTERPSEGILNLKNDDFGDGCHQEMTNNKALDDCNLISLSEKCTSLEQQRNYTGSVVLEEDTSRIEDPVIEVHGMKPEKDVSFSFSENGTDTERPSEGIVNVKNDDFGDGCHQEMTNNKAVDDCDLISLSEKCTSLEQQRNYTGSVVLDASKIQHPVIELHGVKLEKDTSFLCSQNETPKELSEGILNLKEIGLIGDECGQEMTNNKVVDACDFISLSEKCASLEQQGNYIESMVLQEDASKIKDPVIEVHGMKPEKDTSFLCSRNETPTERFEGPVNLKSADDRDRCSEEVENNNTVNSCAYYTSLLENGTFLEGKKNSIHSVDLEDYVSMIEEPKTGLQELKAIQNTAQLPVPQDTGLKVAGVLDSQSISSDSDKAIQVYAMTTVDKELEVISAESSTQRENIKDEASSLSKNSSDSDDESSSSESLTSSDSSSDEELEDIRKEIEREEEKVQVGPLKTKSEILIKELPEVPELDISIDGNVQLVEIGLVFSVVETLVVVKALPCTPALDEESILFLENRSCLGLVFETFGPVQRPFYSVRFNKESDIKEKNVLVGDKVLYAPDIMEYSHYVFVSQLKKLKGSDASWEHDEEPPVEVIDYSDDEEEARAKSSRKKERVAKRGLAENTSSPKMNEGGGATVHQETQKGSRKRSWKNRAKDQPVNLDLTSNQETSFNNPEAMQKGPMSSHEPGFAPEAVGRPFMDHSTSTQHSVFNNTEAMQRGPMSWHKPSFAPPAVGRPFMDHSTSTQHSVFNNTEAMQRGPMSWHKPSFAPPAVGRPFMDHFTSTQHSGMGPVAPPRGIPFGRFPPSGPPPRGQLNMTPVPPYIRQFQGMLPCEPLRPLSGGPRFQGPWPVGAPSGFAIRYPMLPLQGSDPRFQGQHYMGIPPPRPPST